nr:hypothetical protein CFP56_56499 [Quercus suber]
MVSASSSLMHFGGACAHALPRPSSQCGKPGRPGRQTLGPPRKGAGAACTVVKSARAVARSDEESMAAVI